MTDSSDQSRRCLRDNKSNNNEVDCPWYINSPEHSNCFWQFVKSRSAIDGSMPELVQSEIAQLLGWSNTKTHFMLKQAMVELVDALNKFKANQLLSVDPDQTVDISSFSIDLAPSYSGDESED